MISRELLKPVILLAFCVLTAAIISVGIAEFFFLPSGNFIFERGLAMDDPAIEGIDGFRPTQALSGAMPSIIAPPLLTEDQASETIRDDELVLGVVVNGQARAYPINMLTGPDREIVNDVLGERAIAATW